MTKIQKFMIATFVRVRVGVGVIGILFPLVLWGVGRWHYQIPLAPSMSAYYHVTLECRDPLLVQSCKAELDCGDAAHPGPCKLKEPPVGEGKMRNWFVGGLFIMGACLYLIHGFSSLEKVFLNLAGLLAVMVALNPMPWKMEKSDGFPIHYVSAVSFFLMISLVCLVCSGKTLTYFPNKANREQIIARYKWTYRVLSASVL